MVTTTNLNRMPMEAQQKFTKVFEERISALLKDHYCKRVDSRLPHLWFVRLKHMSNGNTIVLRGYPHEGTIYQRTNNNIVHVETVE